MFESIREAAIGLLMENFGTMPLFAVLAAALILALIVFLLALIVFSKLGNLGHPQRAKGAYTHRASKSSPDSLSESAYTQSYQSPSDVDTQYQDGEHHHSRHHHSTVHHHTDWNSGSSSHHEHHSSSHHDTDWNSGSSTHHEHHSTSHHDGGGSWGGLDSGGHSGGHH